ncbi:uncharacterized protein VTP21DRAFT_2099 [Calcarisporiella thermophila]|uniref:uncharacterized protein n=1 Tax=Calcarisporiella thermophila TaxID=911321 RepID=UPI00374290C4
MLIYPKKLSQQSHSALYSLPNPPYKPMKLHPFTRFLHHPTEDKLVLVYGNQFQILDTSNGRLIATTHALREGATAKPTLIEGDSHNEEIRALAFNTQGNLLATSGEDKILKLWDVRELKCKNSRTVAKRPMAVCFDNSDTFVVVADKFGDVYNHKLEATEGEGELLLGHVSMIINMILSFDNKYVITCDRDEHIRVSLYPRGYNIKSYCLGHTKVVISLVQLPWAPELIVSGGGDNTIRVWKYLVGQQAQELNILDILREKIPDINFNHIDEANQQHEESVPDGKSLLTITAIRVHAGLKRLAVFIERLPMFLVFEWDEAISSFNLVAIPNLNTGEIADGEFDKNGNLWVACNPPKDQDMNFPLVRVFLYNTEKNAYILAEPDHVLTAEINSSGSMLVETLPDLYPMNSLRKTMVDWREGKPGDDHSTTGNGDALEDEGKKTFIKPNAAFVLSKKIITLPAEHPAKQALSQRRQHPYSPLTSTHRHHNKSQPETYGHSSFSNAAMRVVLTEEEANLCKLLDDVTKHIQETRPDLPKLELRIAGGWVRDKLLGLQCHDIDVAINTMMGFEFAQHVNKYLAARGIQTRSVAKIDTNPEKSKHLETATTRLLGLEIDFVNLRKELYDGDSRIPKEVQFGTPEEDAYRRDITINSLFYNVHSHRVEDYTGQGIRDLAEGIVRTPLPAFETFRDDPLRVLRCIRFASRFSFRLVENIKTAAADERIREALHWKISRERIGTEVDRMIRGPNPVMAFEHILEFGLYDSVFLFPSEVKVVEGEIEDFEVGIRAARIFAWLLANRAKTRYTPVTTEDQQRFMWLVSALMPYRSMVAMDKKKEVPAVHFIIREGLKFANSDNETISKLMHYRSTIQEAVRKHEAGALTRVKLGTLIMDIASTKVMQPSWPLTITTSLIDELLPLYEQLDTSEQVASIIQRYQALMQMIRDEHLEECWRMRPLLDGKEVAKLLGIRPGPVIRNLLQDVLEWQLATIPSKGLSKEEEPKFLELCKIFVRERYNEYGRGRKREKVTFHTKASSQILTKQKKKLIYNCFGKENKNLGNLAMKNKEGKKEKPKYNLSIKKGNINNI